jgi:hypothetical protein
MNRIPWFCLAAVFAVWFLVPDTAYAWGPLAHLDFGLGAVARAAVLAPAVARLLKHHTHHYLYGTLAADLVLGKNFAPYGVHCHNWQVGFRVLRAAELEDEESVSFAFGFLTHLAADTVAHNYYVPYKMVESFGKRGTKHGYWEMRFDAAVRSEVWKTARAVSHAHYRRHDILLQRTLTGQHLPFALNRQVFSSLLLAVRRKSYAGILRLSTRREEQTLTEEQMRECEEMAATSIVDVLAHRERSRVLQADPTGQRNLKLASDLRGRLRMATRDGRVQRDLAREIADSARPAFRESIYGKANVPRLP